MATYKTTDTAIYLSDEGRMVFVGEQFTTNNVPGSTWEPVDDEALAKCKAAFPDKYPADEAPADEAPADEAPADEAPARRGRGSAE